VIVGGAAAGAVILGWRRDMAVLAVGLVAMAVADTAYLYAEATTGYVEGSIYDSAWVFAAALIAFAAWQPRREAETPTIDGRAVLVPSIAAGGDRPAGGRPLQPGAGDRGRARRRDPGPHGRPPGACLHREHRPARGRPSDALTDATWSGARTQNSSPPAPPHCARTARGSRSRARRAGP
jgi:hypothetical protein